MKRKMLFTSLVSLFLGTAITFTSCGGGSSSSPAAPGSSNSPFAGTWKAHSIAGNQGTMNGSGVVGSVVITVSANGNWSMTAGANTLGGNNSKACVQSGTSSVNGATITLANTVDTCNSPSTAGTAQGTNTFAFVSTDPWFVMTQTSGTSNTGLGNVIVFVNSATANNNTTVPVGTVTGSCGPNPGVSGGLGQNYSITISGGSITNVSYSGTVTIYQTTSTSSWCSGTQTNTSISDTSSPGTSNLLQCATSNQPVSASSVTGPYSCVITFNGSGNGTVGGTMSQTTTMTPH